MHDWRENILKELVPQLSRLTLVSDPDHLFSEERLQIALQERGFDLLEYEGAIEFRYIYESQYRHENSRELIVAVSRDTLSDLPYDILKQSRQLNFNLAKLFPSLSYPVVRQLDKRYLDKLYSSNKIRNSYALGDKKSMDFILRHVFEISVELIRDKVGLLKCLLRCHHNSRFEIPMNIKEYLYEEIRKNPQFEGWPLKEIICSAERFYAFLQAEWPYYLEEFIRSNSVGESPLAYIGKNAKGIPFGHDDILVYIDNLFLEGKLKPVIMPESDIAKHAWVQCGIREEKNTERIERLFSLIERELPQIDDSYSDWLSYASKWAQLSSMIYTSDKDDFQRLQHFSMKLNRQFSDWLDKHYTSLINIPPMHVAMVHHIPRRLSRELDRNKNKKIALLVIDGLAMDQWVSIRNVLDEKFSSLIMKESASFAWIPTLTSVSRQAIFAGKIPIYFADSIHTTGKEPKLWQQFWEDQGLTNIQIAYGKNLGKGKASTDLEKLIATKTKVIGLVINTVDDIMHGMELGAEGMYNQVKQWVEKGYLPDLIEGLLERGFDVWLTSDHGNIECFGKGRPAEGAIAEIRGERVRIYPTAILRDRVEKELPFARHWDSVALPAEYFSLIAKENYAFLREGESVVGHGGASIEEVIVPFIKFERRS
jgi:hypothetical protein